MTFLSISFSWNSLNVYLLLGDDLLHKVNSEYVEKVMIVRLPAVLMEVVVGERAGVADVVAVVVDDLHLVVVDNPVLSAALRSRLRPCNATTCELQQLVATPSRFAGAGIGGCNCLHLLTRSRQIKRANALRAIRANALHVALGRASAATYLAAERSLAARLQFFLVSKESQLAQNLLGTDAKAATAT